MSISGDYCKLVLQSDNRNPNVIFRNRATNFAEYIFCSAYWWELRTWLKLSLPEPVEGNIPVLNHLRQAQVAGNCVTHNLDKPEPKKIKHKVQCKASLWDNNFSL